MATSRLQRHPTDKSAAKTMVVRKLEGSAPLAQNTWFVYDNTSSSRAQALLLQPTGTAGLVQLPARCLYSHSDGSLSATLKRSLQESPQSWSSTSPTQDKYRLPKAWYFHPKVSGVATCSSIRTSDQTSSLTLFLGGKGLPMSRPNTASLLSPAVSATIFDVDINMETAILYQL